ncbi:MAG: glycosyltransferase family 2 protein [candidate division WOR-3 bacterium]|nr:glycosyltransferase family 2 protein [candidate division WOR-3 bacterium]
MYRGQGFAVPEFPLISIGILTYNRSRELRTTLDCLLRDGYPNREIIVVDNHSSDDTQEMLQREFGGCRELIVYRTEKNIGVGARNLFLKNARGKYVFQYDDDSQPADSATIKNIVEFLETSGNEIDVLCTRVVNFYDQSCETQDWEVFAWGGDANQGFRGHFIHGSGTIFRSSALRQISGYPEDFFWGFEEADLTLQFLLAGSTIVYKPDFITLHRRRRRQFSSPLVTTYYVRNGVLVFNKYFTFPYNWLLCKLWIMRHISKNLLHFKSVIAGARAGFSLSRNQIRARRKFPCNRKQIFLWIIHTLLPSPTWKFFKLIRYKFPDKGIGGCGGLGSANADRQFV